MEEREERGNDERKEGWRKGERERESKRWKGGRKMTQGEGEGGEGRQEEGKRRKVERKTGVERRYGRGNKRWGGKWEGEKHRPTRGRYKHVKTDVETGRTTGEMGQNMSCDGQMEYTHHTRPPQRNPGQAS